MTNPRDAHIARILPFGDPALGLTMDLYAAAGRAPHPGVIIIHGGGFTSGTSRNGSEAYCADFLAPAGYAVFSINYRQAPATDFAGMIADVKAAIRYVRDHAAELSVDPNKLVLLGGSAGGYLSNIVGLDSAPATRVAAVVTLYGISDIPHMPDPTFVTKNHLLGPDIPNPASLATASPLAHVHPGAPPFLFVHGDHDASVPIQQSISLQEALRGAGGRADLITIPGGTHGTWAWHSIPGVPDWERQMTEWLNKTLHHEGSIGEGIEARSPKAAD